MSLRSILRAHLPLLRWLGQVLIFFAIPLLIVTAGFGRMWERQERERHDQAFTRLDRHLALIRKRSNTIVYLGAQFDALKQFIRRSPFRERTERMRKAIATFHARFPGMLRIIMFDREGRRLCPELDPSVPDSIVRRLSEVLCGEDETRLEAANRYRPILSAFLGPGVEPEQLAQGAKLKPVDANPGGEWRWLSFATGKWGGFCIQVRMVPDWDQAPLNDQIRLLRQLRPKRQVDFGLVDLRRHAYAPPDVAVALRQYGVTTRQHALLPASLVTLQQIDAGVFLWASIPRRLLGDFDSRRLRLIFWVTAVFSVLCLVSARVMLGQSTFVLSIRQRLLLLFAFAGGVPLVLIAFAQWDALQDLERRRSREATEAMERHLQALDNRYANLRADIELKLGQMLRPDRFADLEARKNWREVLEEVRRSFSPREIYVFNPNGKVLLRYQENANPPWMEKNIREEGSTRLLGSLIRTLCSRLQPVEESVSGEMAVSIAEQFTGGELPVGEMVSNLGKVFEITVFRDQHWIFLQPMRSAGGRIERVVSVSWKRDLLERLYLQRAIPEFEKIMPEVRLMAWSPVLPLGPLPSNFPLYGSLRPFLAQLEAQGGTVFGDHDEPGHRYLLTGVKPRRISDHLLLAVREDNFISAERTRTIRLMVGFTLGLFAVTIFLGYILSQRFLQPIGHLTTGIEAIAERDFQHRLPPGDLDELGRLSETFNRMMEGLSDLEVGRIVQESLFPKDELVVGAYRAFGQTHAATELGGDYYDVKRLPDDRILLIIGDVTGHGVGPAMVMAMAKIMVEYCLSDFDLERFTVAFNDSLFKVMKRKRFMSCFLGIVDTKRHVMQMVNAGHNFPYLVRGSAHLLEDLGNSYPIGSRASLKPKVVELPMEAGDTLLFYTDGLIETDTGATQIGYEGVAEALPRYLDADLPASCERIWAWNRELAQGKRQEDDITLLMLHRERNRG